jgi:hypothetical protein
MSALDALIGPVLLFALSILNVPLREVRPQILRVGHLRGPYLRRCPSVSVHIVSERTKNPRRLITIVEV